LFLFYVVFLFVLQRYSEFINYPIFLHVTKSVEKEVVDEEATAAAEAKRAAKEAEKAEKEAKKAEEGAAEKEEGDEDVEVSDEDETTSSEDDGKPVMKKVTEQVAEWQRVNDVKAIWTRAPRDITEEEYTAFYRTLTKDENTEPLTKIHFTAEGEITFRAILFCPKKAPSGLYDKFYEKSTALRLYVRRVLISDEFDEFLPRYLNFVRGVVDSEDLPLNVSRETLAQSRVLKVMAKKITRKVLEMLKKMADAEKDAAAAAEEEGEDEEKKAEEETPSTGVKESEQYPIFWKEFGKSIKLGVIDDRANKAKLAKLLRYQTSKSEGKLVSLEEYVDRMDAKQKHIYYITGESIDTVKHSPFLERVSWPHKTHVLAFLSPHTLTASHHTGEFIDDHLHFYLPCPRSVR
jgi:heat shock protein beta